jgi:hypothetical protein
MRIPRTLIWTLAVVALVGCDRAAVTSTGGVGQPEPVETALPASALDLLDCHGPPSDVGGEAGGLAAEGGGGDTPDEALDAFLAQTAFVVPRSNYQPLGRSGERFAYGYVVDGEVKVVVIISPEFGAELGSRFAPDELRMCDHAEFGADADLGPDTRTWTHDDTGLILTDIPGPGHCGWESARMLHVENEDGSLKQYLRDPLGVFTGVPLLDSYAEGVALPADATFSGYRSEDGLELWFTAEDSAAYVVTPDGVERWPRPAEPIGCA